MSFDYPIPLPSDEEVSRLTYDQLAEHFRRSRANAERYRTILPRLKQELEERTPERNYKCMKCGHLHFEPHEIRASDGTLSSMFDLEPAKYRALVCQRCKFTEFYQGSADAAQQVLDFLFG